jgi:hypothetical protein
VVRLINSTHGSSAEDSVLGPDEEFIDGLDVYHSDELTVIGSDSSKKTPPAGAEQQSGSRSPLENTGVTVRDAEAPTESSFAQQQITA